MLTVIESPYRPTSAEIARFAGTWSAADLLRQNLKYARLLLADSLRRGEVPFASHLLFTQVWAETPELRTAGIRVGQRAHLLACRVVFGAELGWSAGMDDALESCALARVETETRSVLPAGTDARAYLQALPFEWPEILRLETA